MKNYFFYLQIILLITSCSTLKKSFSKKEIQLIMNADSLAPMRIYKIDNKRDSILLRTKSAYIKPNPKDITLANFVKRLQRTVRDSLSIGVGIAAPQVGVLRNIILVKRFDKDNFPFEVYLNPKIKSYSNKKQTAQEGCLSIPNRRDSLNIRAYNIIVEYDTMLSEHKTESIDGFTSIIFQHEIDHLNGILYLDHLKKESQKNN